MIRLALGLALILVCTGTLARADARSSAKFVKTSKAPGSPSYPAGCGPRDDVAKALTGKFGEKRVGAGKSRRGPVEVYAGPKGTFTVVLTAPDGSVSCILSDGGEWRDFVSGGA